MTKQNGADLDHMDWLVRSRSENQRVSLDIFKLMQNHQSVIDGDEGFSNVAQALVGSCFSLWRAVFLSEVGFTFEKTTHEAKSFLENLILHNSVTYIQDYKSREWSFLYYVNNARYRLERISETYGEILHGYKYAAGTRSPKDLWTLTHEGLQTSVNNFGRVLVAKGQ